MDIHERVVLFYERLSQLKAFASHDEALFEISRILTEIEDAHSGVPRDPSDIPLVTSGRMYPPHPAFAAKTELVDVFVYRQKGHLTYIRSDGAVLIANRRTRAIEFDKPGHTGERISL